MQSAFWVVDGYYQSYETTNLQVEVDLDVQRMLGRTVHVNVKGLPGEEVCSRVKDAIDTVVNKPGGFLATSRVSELRAQLSEGKELAGLDLVYPQAGQSLDDEASILRRRRNLDEAMRAFKTVLLLDPENREAKMCLAACLRHPAIYRVAEAREYYRELVEGPVQDKWSDLARRALVASFDRVDPSEAVEFFESAASEATNSPVVQFYRRQAELAATNAVLAQAGTPEAERLAEARLIRSIESFEREVKAHSFRNELGMFEYVESFGADRDAGIRRLTELLPGLKKQFPEIEPYLLADAVSFQQHTDAPVVAEFQSQLASLCENPTQVLVPEGFWLVAKDTACDWAFRHARYDMAAIL